jgi:hypothetical protein
MNSRMLRANATIFGRENQFSTSWKVAEVASTAPSTWKKVAAHGLNHLSRAPVTSIGLVQPGRPARSTFAGLV